MGLTAFGQVADNSETTTKTKKCIPTKECAAKMGMSLEECKKKCAKVCGSKTANAETKVASYEVQRDETVSTEASTDKKSCGKMSLKECAAKMGMTVEECKKKCSKVCGSKTGGTADNTVESNSSLAERK